MGVVCSGRIRIYLRVHFLYLLFLAKKFSVCPYDSQHSVVFLMYPLKFRFAFLFLSAMHCIVSNS